RATLFPYTTLFRSVERPELRRRPVEHRVHELVPLLRAEALREVDGFVDHDAERNLGTVAQLVDAEQQDAALDGVELRDRPVRERRHVGFERLLLRDDRLERLVEEPGVRALVPRASAELPQELRAVVARELALVQRLHQKLASPPARVRVRPAHGGIKRLTGETGSRMGGVGYRVAARIARGGRRGGARPVRPRGCYARRRSRLTISSAASAASSPLLPAFVPARSIACSIVSTVSTPTPTGMPCARDAATMPWMHWAETCSKCGVAPRMTAPSATMASERRVAATFSTASGSSIAPGTRTSSRSASTAPWRRRQPIAPRISASTIVSLNREATSVNFASRAERSPSIVFIVYMPCLCLGGPQRPRRATRRRQPSTYSVTSRSNPESACICFGADSTRIRCTPRSFRICAPTP